MAGFEVSINGRFWVSTEDVQMPSSIFLTLGWVDAWRSCNP